MFGPDFSGSTDDLTLREAKLVGWQARTDNVEKVAGELASKVEHSAAAAEALQKQINIAVYEKDRLEKALQERMHEEERRHSADATEAEFEAAMKADTFQDSELSFQLIGEPQPDRCHFSVVIYRKSQITIGPHAGFTPTEACSASVVFFVLQFYHFPPLRSRNA
eukprot:SAG11_NODE_11063_length_786_cov_0.997089_2_plen_165_part_00